MPSYFPAQKEIIMSKKESSSSGFIETFKKNLGWIIIAAAAILGFGIVGGVLHHVSDRDSFFYHALRDVGIAFIVAAIVAVTFELHARMRYQIDTIDQVFDTTMGAIWNSEVWEEVRQKVFEKKIIRENYDLHLTLFPETENRMIMQVRLRYDVRSLLHNKESIEMCSTLDKHICDTITDKNTKIPCFTALRIDDKSFNLLDLKQNEFFQLDDKEGRLIFKLEELAPNRDNRPIRLEVVRKEFSYIPGTYNLTMSDITKIACVHMLNLPDNIEASIFLPAHFEIPKVLGNDQPLDFDNKILLPGQTIEFHFKIKDSAQLLSRPLNNAISHGREGQNK